MKCFRSGAAIVLIVCTTACASNTSFDSHGAAQNAPGVASKHAFNQPPMDPGRRISGQDCRHAFPFDGSNLRCN